MSENRSKNFLNFDIYGNVKVRNKKFSVTITYNI